MPGSASTRKAIAILAEVFAHSPKALAVTLWDGTTVELGKGKPDIGLVLRDKRSFQRIFLRPDVLRLAEAFIRKDLEIQGEILQAVRFMDCLSNLKLSFWTRLRLFGRLLAL